MAWWTESTLSVHGSTDSSLNGIRWLVDLQQGLARPKGYEGS
jgi:hypothetical protein